MSSSSALARDVYTHTGPIDTSIYYNHPVSPFPRTAQQTLMLEQVEKGVNEVKIKTRPLRSIGVKSVVGLMMMFRGAHFSRCLVLFHSIRSK